MNKQSLGDKARPKTFLCLITTLLQNEENVDEEMHWKGINYTHSEGIK